MEEIFTEIEASVEKVWEMLTDFLSYPRWNMIIRWVSGNVRTGVIIKVYLKLYRGTGMNFRPKVLKVEPNHEFRWLGEMFVQGLFAGRLNIPMSRLNLVLRYEEKEKIFK